MCIENDGHVLVLGTVGYGRGVDPTTIPEEDKVAEAAAALSWTFALFADQADTVNPSNG